MKRPEWIDTLQPFAFPDSRQIVLFVCTSIIPYLSLVAVMLLLRYRGFPYWIVAVLSVPAIGFYIRTFMILHDCSHSSFARSKVINYFIGHICGIITLTPFFDWQRNHGIHHATVSNLDKRGTGDVWVMTLREYRSANFLTRLRYRIYRNPFFLFGLAPAILFCIMYRFPQKSTRRKDYFSIILTDIAIISILLLADRTIGLKLFLSVQLLITIISTCIGLWLFYIQHQFEKVYWAHNDEWDIISAAMEGSSFYKLPGVLRWFTANIGYHNIHHLKPRIPCYNLKRCYDAVPELHSKEPITLSSGFRSMRLHVWDEVTRTLVGFRNAKT
jgi:omega-6 fatty acid desaturase (delta-12 desaturase)